MKYNVRHYLLPVALSVLIPSGSQPATAFPFPGKSRPATTIKNVVKPGTVVETNITPPGTAGGERRPSVPAPLVDKIDPLKADVLPADKAKTTEKHMKLGDMFFERHDYTNALIEYEEVVKVDPRNFKAHWMLGKVLMGMSDFEEALGEFETTISIRPTSGDAHFMKGEALRMLGKYQEANDEYTSALKIDRGNALAHAYLAECYRMRKDWRPAIAECKRAIS